MIYKKHVLKYLGFLILISAVLLPAVIAGGAVRSETVRVVLARQDETLSFQTSGHYQLVDLSTGEVITSIKSGAAWQVERQKNKITVRGGGEKYGPFSGPVAVQESRALVSVRAADGETAADRSLNNLTALNAQGEKVNLDGRTELFVRDTRRQTSLAADQGLNLIALRAAGTEYRRYRGDMEFRAENDSLLAINEVNIEDYLRGVVPAEMPSSWPAEALKAQAVVARNYALQRVEVTRGASYHLTNDQYSQVYGGYDAESPTTNRAIEDTRGVVMLHRGSLISALFHSSSGGYIENSEDVWKYPLPYIEHKKDPYDRNERHYDWEVSYTADQLLELMAKAGYDFENITGIEITGYTASGARVKELAVSGTDSRGKRLRVEIANADNVRNTLGLKSALFTMEQVYERDKTLSGVEIRGSGWGHGVGLSQWGASGMASKGYKYRDILQYYYADIKFAGNYGR